MRNWFIAIAFILLVTTAACNQTAPPVEDDILAPLPTADAELPTLLDLIAEDPNLAFFLSGLNNVGLTDDLQNGGPFTVFASSNIAFSDMRLVVSQMDPALLGEILDNHLVEGAYSATELFAAESVVTLAGEVLPIVQDADSTRIAYAPLVGEPRMGSNGTLFVIDTLLLPPESGPEMSMWGVLQADGRFSRFIAASQGTEMMGELKFGDSVDAVLAPTDEAFANLSADLLDLLAEDTHAVDFLISFHLLSPDGWPQGTDLTTADLLEMGEVQSRAAISDSGFGFGFEKLPVTQSEQGLMIGEALVVQGDMDATNGIVHAIDTVLVPEALAEHLP